jgi:hypothetical protein
VSRLSTMRLPLRRSMLCAVLVGAALAPATATAGTYDVVACDAAGGVNNSWAAVSNHPDLLAYAECPSGGDGRRGLVARHALKAANAPAGAYAHMRFDAPAGTAVVGLRASYRFFRSDSSWQVGLSNGRALLRGCPAGHPPCDMGSADEFIGIPASSTIYIETFCPSGCSLDSVNDPARWYRRASASLYSATVRIQDDAPPTVSAVSGGLWSDGWKGGVQDIRFAAGDSAGVRSSAVLVDGTARLGSNEACDYTRPAPCRNSSPAFQLDTTTIKPDGQHALAVEVVDAAGNPARVGRTVLIDNTAPVTPLDVQVAGGAGWRSTNDFDLGWRNPTEAAAPIAGAEFEICPAGTTTCCVRGSRSGKGLSSIEDLKVPSAGEWDIKVWLRDEAGNHDPKTAAVLKVGWDDAAPELHFTEPDPNDPTLLALSTRDAGSGVVRGSIEIKSVGSEAWRPLPSSVQGRRVLARLDDERLRDGRYELRGYGADAAGNERTTQALADGGKAELRLPLRIKTSLRAGVVRRGRKTRFRSRAFIRYGTPVRVTGRLTARGGNPVQDTEVVVLSRIRADGAQYEPLATVKTSRTGRFSFRVPRGPSRVLQLRYGGTGTVRSATRMVSLLVRGRSTMRRDKRSYLNGEVMQLSGRLRGGRIPAEGKLVELQVRLRGSWRTFATTRADAKGRWSYGYRFDGTRGRQTYRFRVRVPRESNYPYDTGTSRAIRVPVRGV